MIERLWGSDSRKTIVCIDSYDGGNPRGRMYNSYLEMDTFESLSQFLIKMEVLLDENQMPQSCTETRSFTGTPEPPDNAIITIKTLYNETTGEEIELPEPTDPEPDPEPEPEPEPEPDPGVPANDPGFPIDDGGDVIIPDGEVPLADAPKTGDISLVWALLSILSMGGVAVLNIKRRK